MTDKVTNIFKNKRNSEGRQPLYVSHKNGKIQGPTADNFETRLARIRASVERINKLMSELKKMGEKDDS